MRFSGFVSVVWLMLAGLGCRSSEDDATQLARILRDGARDLRSRAGSEIVVPYTPLSGVDKPYIVLLIPRNSDPSVDLVAAGVPEAVAQEIRETQGDTFTRGRLLFYRGRHLLVPPKLDQDYPSSTGVPSDSVSVPKIVVVNAGQRSCAFRLRKSGANVEVVEGWAQ